MILQNVKTKEKINVQAQTYSIGLYIVIYDMDNRMLEQMGIDQTKEQVLEDIKKHKFLKGWKILEGTL